MRRLRLILERMGRNRRATARLLELTEERVLDVLSPEPPAFRRAAVEKIEAAIDRVEPPQRAAG